MPGLAGEAKSRRLCRLTPAGGSVRKEENLIREGLEYRLSGLSV